MVQAGNMRTGGPAKTAAALKRISDAMTDEQRTLLWPRLWQVHRFTQQHAERRAER
jgi:hypothetical protein